MTQTIQLKRSEIQGRVPLTSELVLGEVAINTYDGKLFIKRNNGTDSIVEIVTSLNAQPLDADLTAISALSGTSGYLKKTAADTWTLDTNTYLTSHPTIAGATSVNNTGLTYIQDLTFDSNGHVTGQVSAAIQSASTIQQGVVQLSDSTSTTSSTVAATSTAVKSAYDLAAAAQPGDADLTAIAALAGTSGFLKKTAANTWSLDTSTYLTSYTESDTLATVTGRGATTTTAISITNSTASSSTGTGALIVTGGVGVGGSLNVGGDFTLTGNLTVNGTTTTVNSTTITVDDKNIELGSVATPTNTTADGGGITLKGTTDKTFNWTNATTSWTSSENIDLASGKIYQINGTSVLSATTLGSGVTASSLTSVGTITTGTWSGSFGAVSGANLTSLTAGNLSGTIPSAVLGNSTHYVGTTAVALNRASANQGLTGISSVALPGATSGTITLTPAAVAGTTAITIPAVAGTLVTTGDTGTVTNTMLAGSIANTKLVSSTISGVSLGSNLNALTLGTGLTGTSYNGSAAVTVNVDSVAAGTPSIYSSITTGSLTIGAGLTTGSINIATGTDSAKVVNIGTTSATSTITGIVKLPTIGTSGFVKLGAGGQLSADTSTYLTAESDTLATVTGRGATTATAISITNATASSSTSTGALILSGGVGVAGNINAGGYITAVSAGASGQIQAIGGSASTWYNSMLRNDGTNVYLLSSAVQTTSALATNAGWNTYRPFSWNLSTGAVSIASDGSATSVGGNLTVTGNLTINGTTTTVNSTTVTVDDPVITLGGDTAPAADDNKDRGIEFRYHNGTAAKVGFFGFDDSTGKLTFIPDATNTSEVFSGTKGTLDANIEWADILNKPSTGSGSGSVTSVSMTVPTGLTVSGSPITTSGTLAVTLTAGYSIPTTASQTNWDTAYTDRNKWDGGATGLDAATGRTSLGLGTAATVNTGTSGATIPLLNGSNTWSNNQVITGSSASALVSITNSGAGVGLSIDDITASTGITSNSISTTNGNTTSATLTTSVNTAGQVVMNHAIATYRSVQYQIQIVSGSAYHSTIMNVIHDGASNVYATEYGTIFSGSSLATFDADISGGNLRLLVSPVNQVNTIKVIASAINV